MIHPSYQELMEKVNEINETIDVDDAPVISSRYSLVLAASKRARQLTDGAEPKVALKSDKQLSVAVDELYKGEINILSAPAEEENTVFGDAEAMAAAEEFDDLFDEAEDPAEETAEDMILPELENESEE